MRPDDRLMPGHLKLAAADGITVMKPRVVWQIRMPSGQILTPKNWTIVDSPDGSCRALADDGETIPLPAWRAD